MSGRAPGPGELPAATEVGAALLRLSYASQAKAAAIEAVESGPTAAAKRAAIPAARAAIDAWRAAHQAVYELAETALIAQGQDPQTSLRAERENAARTEAEQRDRLAMFEREFARVAGLVGQG